MIQDHSGSTYPGCENRETSPPYFFSRRVKQSCLSMFEIFPVQRFKQNHAQSREHFLFGRARPPLL
eukprot:UN00774